MQGKLLSVFYKRGRGTYILKGFLCSSVGSSAKHFSQYDFTHFRKHLILKVVFRILQLHDLRQDPNLYSSFVLGNVFSS